VSRAASSRVWLWVGVGCAATLILGVIVVGVILSNVLRNPEVKSFVSSLSEMERLERLAPVVKEAMEKYRAENRDFPPNLEALAPYISEEEMKALNEGFTYSKPEPDAPGDQVILRSREFAMPGGGEMQIVIQKDLEAFSVTKSPLKPDFSGWTRPSRASER
jgi:hypothetical protein